MNDYILKTLILFMGAATDQIHNDRIEEQNKKDNG